MRGFRKNSGPWPPIALRNAICAHVETAPSNDGASVRTTHWRAVPYSGRLIVAVVAVVAVVAARLARCRVTSYRRIPAATPALSELT